MKWAKSLFILLTVASTLVSLPASAAKSDDFMEGVHYLRITPAQPTNAPAGKVEIAEMFWYGCPHCFRFEPHIKAWLKSKPDYISFNRVPSPLRKDWEIHSRVYYAAESLGVIDKLHEPFFRARHEQKRPLVNMEDILNFVSSLGIDPKKFESAMKSFAVSSKVQYALKFGRASGSNGVPALVINGKYLVDGRTAGDHVGMIFIANMLAEQEYQAMKKKTKPTVKKEQVEKPESASAK